MAIFALLTEVFAKKVDNSFYYELSTFFKYDAIMPKIMSLEDTYETNV